MSDFKKNYGLDFVKKDYRNFVEQMKILRYILPLFACLLLWQCKPEPVPDPKPEVPDPAISIIGSSDINFSEDAGSGSVNFISTREWTVTTGESWIAVSPAEGGGSGNIVTLAVSCSENPNETPRSGEVVIASGDISRIITVSQSARKPSGPKSQECELTSLNFLPKDNSALTQNISVTPKRIQGIWMLLVTFPEDADISRMVPSFEMSPKASVIFNDQEIEGGKTVVDFSENGPLTVVAEDGVHSATYLVIARRGDIEIDRKVYSFMGAYNIPAVSIATTKGEKLAYCAAYGLAEVDDERPVYCTTEHLFRLASVSKSLTAICILRLCQEGKLSLEDKVFAPGGPLASLYPGSHIAPVDEIKVVDLLTHRSGWTYSSAGTDPVFTGNLRFAGKSLQERVAYMVKYIAPATPGTVYEYYNLGFCILGQVIEQVTGKSYEEYLREVVAMAGANDIWLSKTPLSQKRDNECVFYSQDSAYPYDNNMEVAAACGGVTASAIDMAKVLTAIDYGGTVPDILNNRWLDEMYTRRTSGNYGLGWWIGNYYLSNCAAYHTGSLAGTATLWARGSNGIHGVILCNSRSGSNNFDSSMALVLDKARSRVQQTY